MKHSLPRLALLSSLLFAVVVPACGGDGSSTSGSRGDSNEGQPCLEGQQSQCTCADGALGANQCVDGAFDECVCEPGGLGAGNTSGMGGPLGTGGAAANLCGNGIVNSGEMCDGSNLNGETCASATMNAMPTGALACTTGCQFNVTGCTGGSMGTGGSGSGMGGTMGAGGLMGGGGLLGGGGTSN